MSALPGRSDAVGADRPGRCVLCRLGLLRALTLVAFNAAYVVVPLLLFERTGSLLVVGLAMVAEGLVRALVALWVGARSSGLPPRRAIVVSAALRLVALALLAASTVQFSIVVVALASTLFYVGHFFATLEQELRAATFGARAVAAQTAHRIAEVLAPPVAFAIALAARASGQEYLWLIAAAALAVLVHAAAFVGWFDDGPPRRGPPAPGLGAAWRQLRATPALLRGLAASVVGFTFYGWAVLATPFALTGRTLAGLPLDSAAGTAFFKALAAVVGVAGAVAYGRLLSGSRGETAVVVSAIAAPLVFAAGVGAASDAVAVALLALVCALVLGLFTWQRRLRQVLVPTEQFHGVTSWCMAIECLHFSLIGGALIADAPGLLGAAGSVLLVLLLWPRKAGGGG